MSTLLFQPANLTAAFAEDDVEMFIVAPTRFPSLCVPRSRIDRHGNSTHPVPVIDADTFAVVGHSDGPMRRRTLLYEGHCYRAACGVRDAWVELVRV